MTLAAVAREVAGNPRYFLVERWNWKAAILSATFRATLFLCANLTAGWKAATGAMLAEFLFRSVTAGFYGAITQAFSKVEPEWVAAATTAVLLPVASHSLELAVHLLRGTPRIITSMIASVCFTIVSTLFNVYAMRRGVLIVGAEGSSLLADLRRTPALIAGFLAGGAIRSGRDNHPATAPSGREL